MTENLTYQPNGLKTLAYILKKLTTLCWFFPLKINLIVTHQKTAGS